MSLHPTTFDGPRHSGCKDIVFLVYQLIIQDHVIKGSRHFIDGCPHGKSISCQVWWS